MLNTYLIIYMTHHGTTKKVVDLMVDKLGKENVTLIDLEQAEPDLRSFKTILIGGSIHMGHLQNKLHKFCEKHEAELLQKKIGLFLCFMNKEHAKSQYEEAFPDGLRKHASAFGLFGGELLFEKMHFLERTITKKVMGADASVSTLDYDAIDAFVNEMRF